MDEDGVVSELDRNDFTIEVKGEKIRPDYALILIHGTPGEDGRLQGYLDMMKIPLLFVRIRHIGHHVRQIGLQTGSRRNRHRPGAGNSGRQEYENRPGCRCRRTDLPLFVKPNASGSSFGVTKSQKRGSNPAGGREGIRRERSRADRRVYPRTRNQLRRIDRRRPGIPVPDHRTGMRNRIFRLRRQIQGPFERDHPAPLDAEIVRKVNAMTLSAYKTLNCRGVVRIDFIVKGDRPYLIEVNTIPGMSAHSIIPQQAQAMGMTVGQLYDLIIEDTSKQAE